MTRNFEAYLRLDKKGLENKYVIIVKGEIVATGEDIENMLNRVRQEYPHEIPFVAKVPDEKIMKFAGCWSDMPDDGFNEFLDDIKQRRRLAFSMEIVDWNEEL